MMILGFRGVHPLALLFIPFALAALAGGFWLLRKNSARISRRMRYTYLWTYGLAAAGLFVLLSQMEAHDKYRLMTIICAVAAFALMNLALAGVAAYGRPATQPAHASSRRRLLLGGAVAAAGSVVSLAGVAAATSQEGTVTERRIDLARSPKAGQGRPLRISLVTDLHAGFFLPDGHLTEAARIVSAFKPDVILFGGDLVEHELEFLDQTRTFFRDLAALAPVYAVLGNHDCYVDPHAVAGFLTRNGVRTLRGDSVELAGPWGRFSLCGLRDWYEGPINVDCLRGKDPATTILLAHNPQVGLHLPADIAPWMTLCGHTHGGQMRLPLVGAPINQADRRIQAGENIIEGRRIIVSAGLGYSGLPVRLMCPPDVTNIVAA